MDGFNSLQTGKGVASWTAMPKPARPAPKFQFPSNGKGGSKKRRTMALRPIPMTMFQFPSNGKGGSKRPHFKPSGAVAPKALKKTRTAQCFFRLKILPKNSANPRVHWRKHDFLLKTAIKQGTTWVLGQFPPHSTPINESRLFTYLYISIHDIRKNVKFLSPGGV